MPLNQLKISQIRADIYNNSLVNGKLDLSCMELNDADVKILCNIISEPKNMKVSKINVLDLSGNFITDQGVKQLCDLLLKQNNIATLNLSENEGDNTEVNSNVNLGFKTKKGISLQSILYLSEVLKNKQIQLEHLLLNSIPIGYEGMRILFDSLHHNTSLAELELAKCVDFNQVSNKGRMFANKKMAMESLSKMLKVNQNLKKINLDSNYLSDEGITTFIDASESPQKIYLRNLSLNNNLISDEGFIKFVPRVLAQKTCKLEILSMAENDCEQPSLMALLKGKHHLEYLKSVDFQYNRETMSNYRIKKRPKALNFKFNTDSKLDNLLIDKEPEAPLCKPMLLRHRSLSAALTI